MLCRKAVGSTIRIVYWIGDLIALTLPGNVEARLSQLQAELFRELGDPLLRALCPLVPLYWAAPPAPDSDEPDADSAEYKALLPYRSHLRLERPFEFGTMRTSAALIWVTLSPEESLSSLRRQLEDCIPARTEGPADAVPAELPNGVLLGWRSATPGSSELGSTETRSADTEPVPDASSGEPVSSLRRVEGTVLRIRTDTPALRECARLSWEELASFRVRSATRKSSSDT